MIYKFQAALLGYAIGDALAAPIEDVVRKPEMGYEPIEYYIKAFPSHPVGHLDKGQYSDETQIMLAVAESLLEYGGFSLENLSKHFVDWYHSQKKAAQWRFPSNTMIKSCRKLASGASYSTSGHLSAGVIATCRTVPIALLFHDRPVKLKYAIEKSCKITHTDKRTVGMALALASVIKSGLENAKFDIDTILKRIIEQSFSYVSDISTRMSIIKSALHQEPSIAIERIGNSGFCVESFSAALYWFLLYNNDFDTMITGAANCGGDADAIAAMAGAMFGAWRSIENIPDKWIKPLENSDEIRRIACELYRLKSVVK